MTICSKMYEALDKRLEEKKSLDEIGSELCDAVIDPRGKAIRLIKAHKGEEYLKKNADWLGYQDPRNSAGSNQNNLVKSKEQLEYQDVIEDARNNGMRMESRQPGTSMDEFEDDEVVYEQPQEDKSCSLNACFQEQHNEINIVISNKAKSALQMLTERLKKTQSEVINDLLECSIIEKVKK